MLHRYSADFGKANCGPIPAPACVRGVPYTDMRDPAQHSTDPTGE